MILLGVRTLAGFGVALDNVAHRFVAQATIVAGLSEPSLPGVNPSTRRLSPPAA
jgi:hypothetical protein